MESQAGPSSQQCVYLVQPSESSRGYRALPIILQPCAVAGQLFVRHVPVLYLATDIFANEFIVNRKAIPMTPNTNSKHPCKVWSRSDSE